jgi:hypothetical protein
MSILVFVVAIALSAVAAYYSIIGLVTIFAAAVVPVAIMGTTLEVAKLVTAVWLHNNWKSAPILMKSYFLTAVIVLMLITSMGIFGFLSKAHIEQTATASQNQAILERTDDQIIQTEFRIEELQEAGVVNNEKQNAQIENNKKQIDDINARYVELIDEAKAQNPLILLDKYIADGDTKSVQSLVGVNPDGAWGSRTSRAVDAFRERNKGRVDEINARVQELRDAQLAEVKVLADANARLQSEIGTIKVDTRQIAQLEEQLNRLRESKFELETEYRKLEAEFGPITYISELIYDDNSKESLDDSVRTVILMLIFVFDPLAVLLLIAFNQGYVRSKDGKDRKENVKKTQQTDESVSAKRQSEAVKTPHENDTVVVKEETVVKVKDADVEVKYDKENDEFQFIESPSGINDDRLYPELRAKKEQ